MPLLFTIIVNALLELSPFVASVRRSVSWRLTLSFMTSTCARHSTVWPPFNGLCFEWSFSQRSFSPRACCLWFGSHPKASIQVRRRELLCKLFKCVATLCSNITTNSLEFTFDLFFLCTLCFSYLTLTCWSATLYLNLLFSLTRFRLSNLQG